MGNIGTSLLRSAATVGTFALAMPTAHAVQARQTYNLPEQDLGASLQAVARAAKREIIFRSDGVKDKRAPALEGDYTPNEALDILLKESGLVFVKRNQTILIRERSKRAEGNERSDGSEILVTGSRLRGAPIASPVIALSQRDILNSGQNNLGDVVRAIPQNFGGGQNPGANITTPEKKGNYIGSGSAIDLRGLGGDATLTLLNGHRLAYSGAYQAIDISVIPIAALDRLEIVADGSSALYGSDAVGGVANVILKRDYDGVNTAARFGASSDGGNRQQEYSVVTGKTWQGGGFMLVYDHSHNSPLLARQRDYAKARAPGLTLLPRITQNNVIFTGHQDLAPAVRFGMDAVFNRRASARSYALTTEGKPSWNGATLSFRSRSLSLAPSIEVDVGPSWKLQVDGVYSEDQSFYKFDRVYSGVHDLTAGCYCNDLKSVELSAGGDLVSLPAGPIKAAIGAGYRSSGYHGYRTAGEAQDIKESQGAYFAFGEIGVPVVSPDQQIPGAHRLNLNAAVRFEHYPGVAGVVTPKFGLIYAPTSFVDLKGTWGRSFKAPTFFERYSQEYADIYSATTLGGSEYPSTATVLLLNGGNPDLRPERATTWTITAALHPSGIAGMNVEISYFDVTYKQRILVPIAYANQALSDPQYASFVDYAPSNDTIAQAIGSRVFTNFSGRDYDPGDIVAIVHDSNVNAARQSIRGIDLLAQYEMALSDESRLQFHLNGSYLKSEQRLNADLRATKLAGTVFNPAHFRGRAGVSWKRGGLTASTFVNYTGPVDDTRIGLEGRAGSMTTLDLSARYRFAADAGPLRGVEVSLAGLNILNAEPSAIRTTGVYDTPYDPLNYSPVGRFLSLTVSREW